MGQFVAIIIARTMEAEALTEAIVAGITATARIVDTLPDLGMRHPRANSRRINEVATKAKDDLFLCNTSKMS